MRCKILTKYTRKIIFHYINFSHSLYYFTISSDSRKKFMITISTEKIIWTLVPPFANTTAATFFYQPISLQLQLCERKNQLHIKALAKKHGYPWQLVAPIKQSSQLKVNFRISITQWKKVWENFLKTNKCKHILALVCKSRNY